MHTLVMLGLHINLVVGCGSFEDIYYAHVGNIEVTYHSSTGWSSATVFFNIFPTGTKKLKSYITQWFLSTLHIDILIF